jgi:hypothetical protein
MRRLVLVFGCAAALLAVLAAPAAASAAGRPPTHPEPLIPSGSTTGQAAHPAGAAGYGTTTTSWNWSGYDAVTDGTYKFGSVTATWIVPRVRVRGTDLADAAFWVGLDGDDSETVEQIGTEGYSEGVAGYDAWYEMYPLYPVTIDLAIHPGDVMTGTVTWAQPASFTLTLTDATTNQTYSTGQLMSIPPALASAEAIAEAPSSDMGVLPISDFGIVRFSDCSFDGQPVSAYDWNRINMTNEDDDALVARTSDLGADGASFTVTTDCTPPHTVVFGADGRWHRTAVRLRFVAHDNTGGQGVASTTYSTDGGATWTTGTSLTVAAPANHANDGVHRIRYRSIDKVGNAEVKRTCWVFIDTRRPTPVANWAGLARRGARCALRYLVRDARPGSPTATVTIRIVDRHDKLVRKTVLTGVAVDRLQRYTFTCWLPKGRYRFTVAATDQAGNRQMAAARNTLVVL